MKSKFIILFLLIGIYYSNFCNKKQNENSEMNKVRNVILFVGDGMGMAQVAASSYKLYGRSNTL